MMFWKHWNITEFPKKMNENERWACIQKGQSNTRGAQKCKKCEIMVDESPLLGYNGPIVHKTRLRREE